MKTNHIYCGDAQNILSNSVEFPDNSIDLIYADPPFFTNKNYEVIWGDGYEKRAFEDRWKGGIENYIAWMEPKLRECHRVLKKTGSMYLHCDWHASAHLRILMDKIFTERNFRNEIIWHYRGRGMQSKAFQRKHDTILFYGKSGTTVFYRDAVLVPYDPNHVSRYNKIDQDGRKYALVKNRNGPYAKIYLKDGVVPDDVWDIPFIHGSEAIGYPTQKPEALLERIIKASSNEGNIVLDPFCGCGTAIAVAQRLKRKWVGIDVSPTACKLMGARMLKINPLFKAEQIVGLPRTRDEILAMQPFEFQNWVIQRLMGRRSEKLTGDMGIDGYLYDSTPIQVKQSEHIGRNVVDNFETAMTRAHKTRGVIVAISFGKGAYEEVARARNENGLEIELKTVDDLMAE